MKKKGKGSQIDGQLSIFDVLNIPSDIDKTYSPSDINAVVRQLLDAKKRAEMREREEKKKRKAKEREERLREERERQESHVREVTSMDLPLDWNNSCFEQIPLSKAYYLDDLRESKELIEKIAGQKDKDTSNLRRKNEKLPISINSKKSG